MRTGFMTTALAAAAVLACAQNTDGGVEGYPLTASMDARVLGDSVHLTLHVTNVSPEPLPLEFPSTQAYDFLVRREDGETVWSWSATRSFAQVLTADTLAPGATRSYGAAWHPAGATGELRAEGHLLATGHPVTLAIPLSLDEPGS